MVPTTTIVPAPMSPLRSFLSGHSYRHTLTRDIRLFLFFSFRTPTKTHVSLPVIIACINICNPQLEREILLRARRTDSVWVPHLLCAFQTNTHLNLVMD